MSVRGLKVLTVLVLAISCWLGINVNKAIAASCYQTHSHTVCLIDIKRSAKQFWNYRAVVSVDGVARSQEVYNCRDRQRVRTDGRVVPFETNGVGDLICRKLYRPARSPLQ